MKRFLCLIDTDDRNFYMRSALQKLEMEYPGQMGGICFSPMEARMDPKQYEALFEAANQCDFAVIYFHGGCQNLPEFGRFWAQASGRMPCFFISSLPEEVGELMPASRLTPKQYQDINDYFSRPSEANSYEMLLHIANTFFHLGRPSLPYEELPQIGLYVRGHALEPMEEASYAKAAAASQKPVIGVIIHRTHISSGNVSAIDALTEQLEALGAFPLPVFSSLSSDSEKEESGIKKALDRYFLQDGRTIVKCIIVTTGFSLTHIGFAGEDAGFRTSVFEQWGVPVLQAMGTRYSEKQYEELPQGMDSMSLSVHVFQPEMDGQVITVPYAVSEECGCGGIGRRMWMPLKDRVGHLCRLAMNFTRLSIKENREKKVAVVFHNMPGNHNIGRGAGLDTFESVKHVLDAMAVDGFCIQRLYGSGQEIADELLGALTNDTRWISSEEAVKRSADRVPIDKMKQWFSGLSDKVNGQLADQWGAFPGEVMVEGKELLIPGIINGNVFIGLQPSRAFDAQAERLYHDAVFSPPYSYIAYYRWIEEIFGADAVVHVGTHGTLEWLPGKETGLSKNCYPDICIGCLPHFYIYHMGITGEGIQAKRRSAATILEHLPPSMDDSGVYDKLADLDAALREYYSAKQIRSAQEKVLQSRIFDLAEAGSLLEDLRVTRAGCEADPKKHIEELHLWMEELKRSVVTDGLHIFGQPPQRGKLYENMLRMLLRVRNGEIPSLNDAVLTACGWDPEQVKENPSALVNGRLASAIYDEAVETARRLVKELDSASFQPGAIDAVISKDAFTGDRYPLKRVLTYLCTTVCPRLDSTVDEMTNLMGGLNGGFTEPGLGGNPTRGNVSLLPTGRNFYAGDPSEIPSVGAWTIGQKLAKESLDHYLKETGEYPESIAMVVWSGNTIKTSGEDFGEIFSLMGIRPVYLGSTSKVIGVEAIPAKELSHPRIDVTLRISGLFRDMYPNLMELMDTAVACAAAQDENDEINYIKKHINEDMLELLEKGIGGDEALDQAYLRVFGCPAGGYGAGVANLISNKNWTDYKDLAKVYETWSGNAYGRNHHGTAMPDMFKRRLSTVGMTIKNESTVETDMLSSDDFFSYHGGLVACVKANSGKAPVSVTGHTDDPDRPAVRDTARETARIMRSRILNPKWLEGLKRHGFKGAQEISKAVDSFFGWDASAEVAQDWMYESIAKQFLFDRDTREWIEAVNSGVVYNVAGKLLEAGRRGMWNAKKETLDELMRIYLRTEGLLEEGKT